MSLFNWGKEETADVPRKLTSESLEAIARVVEEYKLHLATDETQYYPRDRYLNLSGFRNYLSGIEATLPNPKVMQQYMEELHLVEGFMNDITMATCFEPAE